MRTSDLARAYFAKAEADLRDAERALRDGSHSTCVFFCQQAVEKALKSILAAEGVETRTRHVSKVVMAHLDRFEKLGGPLLRVLRRASEVSEMLEPHVGRARYPWREGTKVMSPEEYYTKEIAERFLCKARKAMEDCRRVLEAYLGGPGP